MFYLDSCEDPFWLHQASTRKAPMKTIITADRPSRMRLPTVKSLYSASGESETEKRITTDIPDSQRIYRRRPSRAPVCFLDQLVSCTFIKVLITSNKMWSFITVGVFFFFISPLFSYLSSFICSFSQFQLLALSFPLSLYMLEFVSEQHKEPVVLHRALKPIGCARICAHTTALHVGSELSGQSS